MPRKDPQVEEFLKNCCYQKHPEKNAEKEDNMKKESTIPKNDRLKTVWANGKELFKLNSLLTVFNSWQIAANELYQTSLISIKMPIKDFRMPITNLLLNKLVRKDFIGISFIADYAKSEIVNVIPDSKALTIHDELLMYDTIYTICDRIINNNINVLSDIFTE